MRRYIEQLFNQLNSWAFEPFDESIPISEFHPGRETFDYWVMLWTSTTLFMANEEDNSVLAEKVLTELKRCVCRLEQGLPYDLAEAPINRIRRPISFTRS